MKELWDFYGQTEKNFDAAMRVWDKEATGLTEEEVVNSDYLIERRDGIGPG